MRVCLVTPFSWSQPHDVNEHVAGAATALRELGHEVTILAPSGRRRELQAGRRTLARGERADLIALGPAVPISRRSHVGLAARANLRLALQQGGFDVVHGFEPGLPSLSAVALRETNALTVATFLSAERLGFPVTRARRDRMRARVDALIATSQATAAVAAERFPGGYEIVPIGVDTARFAAGPKRRLVTVHVESATRPMARAVIRALDALPDWECVLLHRTPLTVRPAVPPRLRDRVQVRTGRLAEHRAALLAETSVLVPAPTNDDRLRAEARASGCAILEVAPDDAPDEIASRITAAAAAEPGAPPGGFDQLGAELDRVYRSIATKRRPARDADPLRDRDWILVDLHMHTAWSHDCSTDVGELLDHAEESGLGGIAVTDHNVFGGAIEAVEAAAGRDLIVIPGEEIKTDAQGEVIGLFLEQEIPRGMPFPDTLAAIKEQGGIVYLPHPFDRLHAIPDPATLHRHLAEIDVFEVYNARLLRDSFNDEALRFARKYGLLQGAGSDAHVLQGVGTGALRMRRFDGPEEFLLSLRSAEVLRRPKSLAYLQSLKWMAQAKERFVPTG